MCIEQLTHRGRNFHLYRLYLTLIFQRQNIVCRHALLAGEEERMTNVNRKNAITAMRQRLMDGTSITEELSS